MKGINKYVGLDVHKDTTVIAVAEGDRTGDVRICGTFSSELHALDEARQRGKGDGGVGPRITRMDAKKSERRSYTTETRRHEGLKK